MSELTGETREHGPDCDCTRCRGFQPGNPTRAGEANELAATHGAYSPRRLREAAAEEYAGLREAFEPWDPSFELATRSLSEIRARKLLAFVWLDEHGLVDDHGNVRPIALELPKWERRETELLREMAATRRSHIELDLDRLARARGLIELAEVERFRVRLVAIVSDFVPHERRRELVAALREAAILDEEERQGDEAAAVVEGVARRPELEEPAEDAG